jgi:hypothetical protein
LSNWESREKLNKHIREQNNSAITTRWDTYHHKASSHQEGSPVDTNVSIGLNAHPSTVFGTACHEQASDRSWHVHLLSAPPCFLSRSQRNVHMIPSIYARMPDLARRRMSHFLHTPCFHEGEHRRIGTIRLNTANMLRKQRRPKHPERHVIGLHHPLKRNNIQTKHRGHFITQRPTRHSFSSPHAALSWLRLVGVLPGLGAFLFLSGSRFGALSITLSWRFLLTLGPESTMGNRSCQQQ